MDDRAKAAATADKGQAGDEDDGDPDWLRQAAQPGGNSTPAETRSVVALARERIAQRALKSSTGSKVVTLGWVLTCWAFMCTTPWLATLISCG
jgi:hypothetical protein